MAFMHIAVFVWKDDVAREELGRRLKAALDDYVAGVDRVVSYHCGPDAGFTPGTSDFAVVGTFESRDAFVVYRDSAAHQEILQRMIVPALATRSVVQLES